MSFANFQNLFLIAWIIFLALWFSWVLVQVHKFDTLSRRQSAISKPQFINTTKVLVTGTFITTLFLFFLLVIGLLTLPDHDLNIGPLIAIFPICLSIQILIAFLFLFSRLLILKSYTDYLVTDKEIVLSPEPHSPSPNTDKSFDQLSKELSEAIQKSQRRS